MLEPTAIHSYEPPAYHEQPASPLEGPPPSLPFHCVVLEAADAVGGPSPALLHSLREQGCRLVLAPLAQLEKEDERPERLRKWPPPAERSVREVSAPLNKEWYDAVFDQVLSITGAEGTGKSPLERYLENSDIRPSDSLCFACSEAGARAFEAVDAGLIISAEHDQVWRYDPMGVLHIAGADVAASESPTARQLAWLHTVFTLKLWCACLFLIPPPDEFPAHKGSAPCSIERARLSAVRSPSAGARGHPAWAWQKLEADADPVCTFTIGREVVACPDWTPMEPKFKFGRAGAVQELRNFKRVSLYCHSLDVGVAEVNHTVEAVHGDGVRVRVSSKRIVSLARPAHAAQELSVVVLDPGKRNMPDICVRSYLRLEQMSPGWTLHGEPRVDEQHAVLSATYIDQERRTITVTCWHRIVRDDGRGDVHILLTSTSTHVERAGKQWGSDTRGKKNLCAIDLVLSNPRKGSRYTVEKVVTISTVTCPDQGLSSPRLLPRTISKHLAPAGTPVLKHQTSNSSALSGTGTGPYSTSNAPPMLAEIEEEHRSAWRAEWDRADIEVIGHRKAARFQRAVRLFRFHQVSVGDMVGAPSPITVPQTVRQLFRLIYEHLCENSNSDRPSSVVTSRVIVQDPRKPPVMRIEPQVPPACEKIQFNVALGGRWHRFTLTPGTVQILVQGPVPGRQFGQLYGDDIQEPPRFIIPTHESNLGVEVLALPWHEVQVQHSLTELGKPDGSAGGFYSLMRRSRFTRVEVLRRLLIEGSPLEAPDEGGYNDEVLTAPLRGALARLKSAPRPPGWSKGDDEDLHILRADAATRVKVLLAYEKSEMQRDIIFLEGRFKQLDGARLDGEDLIEPEMLLLQEAKRKCATIPGCKGFTFQGEPTETERVKVQFKNSTEVSPAGAATWTSFSYENGEVVLMELLGEEHNKRFHTGPEALTNDPEPHPRDYLLTVAENRVPSWEAFSDFLVNDILRAVVKAGEEKFGEHPSLKPIRNFITDRDGTVNNYCDRYASCVQSAYNAAWLSHFARTCSDNSLFLTAAPLGGRPSAEGLMELCVTPRGEFTYTGSKGREYFDHNTQRVMQADELPQEQRELVDELHRRCLALCALAGNTKFLGIGSGLQRKFGEVTMARNDPAGTVPEPESRRFMAEVRKIKEELDPYGTGLDLHDTGTDMEIFPRLAGGRPSFDKGRGVACLDQKLQFHVAEGPNLICGDTSSDLPMVIAALRLMCGDKMVDLWQERLRQEEEPEPLDVCEEISKQLTSSFLPPDRIEGTPLGAETAEEAEQRAREEAERQAREEKEEEEQAREAAQRLAVIFVITPTANEKAPRLTEKVRRWCELSGAHCAIVPSPDVLVAVLGRFANSVSGRSVTEPLHSPPPSTNGFESAEAHPDLP